MILFACHIEWNENASSLLAIVVVCAMTITRDSWQAEKEKTTKEERENSISSNLTTQSPWRRGLCNVNCFDIAHPGAFKPSLRLPEPKKKCQVKYSDLLCCIDNSSSSSSECVTVENKIKTVKILHNSQQVDPVEKKNSSSSREHRKHRGVRANKKRESFLLSFPRCSLLSNVVNRSGAMPWEFEYATRWDEAGERASWNSYKRWERGV